MSEVRHHNDNVESSMARPVSNHVSDSAQPTHSAIQQNESHRSATDSMVKSGQLPSVSLHDGSKGDSSHPGNDLVKPCHPGTHGGAEGQGGKSSESHSRAQRGAEHHTDKHDEHHQNHKGAEHHTDKHDEHHQNHKGAEHHTDKHGEHHQNHKGAEHHSTNHKNAKPGDPHAVGHHNAKPGAHHESHPGAEHHAAKPGAHNKAHPGAEHHSKTPGDHSSAKQGTTAIDGDPTQVNHSNQSDVHGSRGAQPNSPKPSEVDGCEATPGASNHKDFQKAIDAERAKEGGNPVSQGGAGSVTDGRSGGATTKPADAPPPANRVGRDAPSIPAHQPSTVHSVGRATNYTYTGV